MPASSASIDGHSLAPRTRRSFYQLYILSNPAQYNRPVHRFVIEHLPRVPAAYQVIPLDYEQAQLWLRQHGLVSLIRTTEMIAAIEAGMGATLTQSDATMSLRLGDEALLITLSFGVLLAWAQGQIAPLPDDWRCSLLTVDSSSEASNPVRVASVAEDLVTGEPA